MKIVLLFWEEMGEKTQIPERLVDLIQIFGQKRMGSSAMNNCLKGEWQCCFKVVTGGNWKQQKL